MAVIVRWRPALLVCCMVLALVGCGGGPTTTATITPTATNLADAPADDGTSASDTQAQDTEDSDAAATTRESNVPNVDVCTLVTPAEAATIMGEIKDGPTAKTGIMNEPQCEYTNLEGAWVTFSLYGADRWDWKKGELSDSSMETLAGLGDEAFTAKRGTDSEVYVLKGGAILEVRSSGGMEMARAIAQQALGRL